VDPPSANIPDLQSPPPVPGSADGISLTWMEDEKADCLSSGRNSGRKQITSRRRNVFAAARPPRYRQGSDHLRGARLQFQKQVLSNLPEDDLLAKLSILPTCGTQFFQYTGEWKKLYAEDFTADEKEKIVSALQGATATAGFHVDKTWGETIEERGSQITWSALGQQAPLDEKKKWDSDFAKRKKIKAILDTLIPQFSVRIGGATSIDVTKPGIDKAYGIGKLRDILGISLREMIYIGDALFVGENDYPAEQAGVICIPVRGPSETKRGIEAIIACLDDHEQARIFNVDR
jgi:phosphomannomutase